MNKTGNNTNEIWLSLKVQGRGYVKDSQKETAVFLERILLIRPEQKQ